jgi:hypothetical protein
MLIPIRPADGASPPVWAMIELQGEIERNGEIVENAGFDVGTLTTSSAVSRCPAPAPARPPPAPPSPSLLFPPQGTLFLTIGYHQLEGKVQTLKKPLAVLSKVGGSSGDGGSGGATEYKVVGVVREKYLFKARPKPQISKPQTKS